MAPQSGDLSPQKKIKEKKIWPADKIYCLIITQVSVVDVNMCDLKLHKCDQHAECKDLGECSNNFYYFKFRCAQHENAMCKFLYL